MVFWNSTVKICVSGAMESGVRMETKTKTNWLKMMMVFHFLDQFWHTYQPLDLDKARTMWTHQRVIWVVGRLWNQDELLRGGRFAIFARKNYLGARDYLYIVLNAHSVDVFAPRMLVLLQLLAGEY